MYVIIEMASGDEWMKVEGKGAAKKKVVRQWKERKCLNISFHNKKSVR